MHVDAWSKLYGSGIKQTDIASISLREKNSHADSLLRQPVMPASPIEDIDIKAEVQIGRISYEPNALVMFHYRPCTKAHCRQSLAQFIVSVYMCGHYKAMDLKNEL